MLWPSQALLVDPLRLLVSHPTGLTQAVLFYAAFSLCDPWPLDENSPSSGSSVKELANAMIQQRNMRLSNAIVGPIVHPSFRAFWPLNNPCRRGVKPWGSASPRGIELEPGRLICPSN